MNPVETRLIIRKETKFDLVRKRLLIMFFGKEYEMLQTFEETFKVKKPELDKIVMPKEIKKKEEWR